MYKLLSIEAENFMKYKHLEFDISDLPSGTIFIKVESGESSGAGKSTIFEAIHFLLRGVALRHSTAKVINYDETWTMVKGSFQNEELGETVEILRYKEHPEHKNKVFMSINGDNTLFHNFTATHYQDFIDAKFGNQLSFQKRCISPEMKDFLALTPAEKANQLLTFFDINLEAYHRKATSSHKKLKEDFEIISSEFLKINESYIKLGTKISSYEEFQKSVSSLKTSYKESIVQLNKSLKGVKVTADRLTEQKEQTEQYIQSLDVESSREAILKYNSSLRKLQSAYIDSQADIKNLEGQNNALSGVAGEPVCQSCRQPVNVGLLSEVIDTNKHNLSTLMGKISKIEDMQKQLETKKEEKEEDLEKTSKANEKRKEIENDLSRLRREYERATNDIKNTEGMLAKLDNANCDLELMNENFQKLEVKRNKLQTKKTSVELNLRAWEEWKNQLGTSTGIKQYYLNDILSALNTRINYYISRLFSFPIELEFIMAEDSRGMKIDFDLHGLNFYNCSTGEKHRLNLAIIFALVELNTHKKSPVGFRLYDELFKNIGGVNIKRCMDMLSSFGDEQVFLTSHKDVTDFYSFDRVFIVCQDEDGNTCLRVEQ